MVKISAGRAEPYSGKARPGEIISITQQGILAACGSNALLLERVIPEGKKEMKAADFANGFRLEPGAVFFNGPGISAT